MNVQNHVGKTAKLPLESLNSMDKARFVEVVGPWFGKALWVAQRAQAKRPFVSLDHFHQKLCETLFAATREEKLRLVAAQPDVIGRAIASGQLAMGAIEGQAIGLGGLSIGELDQLRRCN